MSNKISLLYIKASIAFFFVACVWGAIMTFPSVHEFVEAGPAGIIIGMHAHWSLLGWVSLAIIGAIYYIVPVITGKELYSEKAAKAQFWIFTLLIIIGTILGVLAGYQGGVLFIAERFGEINATIGPYMMLFNIISIIEAIVPQSIFAYNIYKTITRE